MAPKPRLKKAPVPKEVVDVCVKLLAAYRKESKVRSLRTEVEIIGGVLEVYRERRSLDD